MSRYPWPELAELPDDVRARIEAVQEKSGFVPNVFMALARRPAEFRAFFDYHDALMDVPDRPGGLTKADRELLVVVTSSVNQCTYCVVAHGAILRIRDKDPLIADLAATNYRQAGLSAGRRAICDLAVQVATAPATVSDADLSAVVEHGYDDEAVWDVVSIASFFAMSNRLASGFQIPPNEEFHLMGRVPRGAT